MTTQVQRATVLIAVVICTRAGTAARADEKTAAEAGPPKTGHVMMLAPADLTWTAGPPALPSGARMSLIEGSASSAGPFTFRLRFPAEYRIPPHWHPRAVHVTVISGTFHMGLGDRFDPKKGGSLPTGGITVMPEKIHHFGWASAETVIQVHGIGPWEINYVDPTDDPRRH